MHGNPHPPPCSNELRYIRCIKPNAGQAPEAFDYGLVLHQLKCSGIFEVTRIAQVRARVVLHLPCSGRVISRPSWCHAHRAGALGCSVCLAAAPPLLCWQGSLIRSAGLLWEVPPGCCLRRRVRSGPRVVTLH